MNSKLVFVSHIDQADYVFDHRSKSDHKTETKHVKYDEVGRVALEFQVPTGIMKDLFRTHLIAGATLYTRSFGIPTVLFRIETATTTDDMTRTFRRKRLP